MACNSLWSKGGRLILRTSPSTRIIGGNPADKCKSDALFFTEKASNSAISITETFVNYVLRVYLCYCLISRVFLRKVSIFFLLWDGIYHKHLPNADNSNECIFGL